MLDVGEVSPAISIININPRSQKETLVISRIVAVGLLVSVLGMGCSSETPTAPSNDINLIESQNDLGTNDAAVAPEVLARWDQLPPMKFEVRIENVGNNESQPLPGGGGVPIPLSPGVWTITHGRNPIFKPGNYDRGLGLEHIAEDGNPTELGANLMGKYGVQSSGIFNTPVGAPGPQPAFPGQAFVFMVEAKPGEILSFATMYAQSNDWFYAPGFFGIPLFDFWGNPMSGNMTNYVGLWDAGTEVDQVPGIGPDQAPRQSAPDTGESEHERIWPPQDGFVYPPTGEVIKITITPMDGV